ncbi:MAG: SHOCT domain-containing protein [Clostridia bacterium]|nr:SHOCT domain-containing protein [Clostridia bacterium]
MDNIVYNEQNKVSFRTPIIILSLVGLILSILSCIEFFAYYDRIYISGDYSYELIVKLPTGRGWFNLLLGIAPCILLVLYILKFHKAFKATILVPVIFGSIAFESVLGIFDQYVHSGMYGAPLNFSVLLTDMAIIVAFGLATFSALKGFPKKILPIIAIGVGFLTEVLSLFDFLRSIEWYLESNMYLYLFTYPISILGAIAFYAALLLFVLKNRIPAIISVLPKKEKKTSEKKNPEQALKVLRDKLYSGKITEEEYQAKRAEIINNL